MFFSEVCRGQIQLKLNKLQMPDFYESTEFRINEVGAVWMTHRFRYCQDPEHGLVGILRGAEAEIKTWFQAGNLKLSCFAFLLKAMEKRKIKLLKADFQAGL